ncbi:MAG: hypothetical protein ACRD37_01920 [Candidatus Acidiferrales bacterium]
MATIRRQIYLELVGVLICSSLALAQQQTVTLREPATVKIENLLKQADLVAVVRIRSGDTEQYPTAVYKAEVLKSFKGTEVGAKIFFGPYASYGLGSEYLVFLHHSEKGIEPKEQPVAPGIDYGRIPSFYEVMYEGYSVMPVQYTCVFDGKDVAQQCDYGIKMNRYQVVLPKTIKTFPSDSTDASNSESRWVRKTVLISFLESLPR